MPSQCCVGRVSLTVPKHLDSCSTFHKSVVTSRAFPSHFVSLFYGLDPPQAPTPNVESWSPVKRLMLAGGVFLDALVYYQYIGCWVLQIPDPFHSCSHTHERWCSLVFPWRVWCLRDQCLLLSSGFHDFFSSCFPFHEGWWYGKNGSCTVLFLTECLWPFRFIATTTFDRIYPGIKNCVGSGFCQILFLSAVFVGFHSWYQNLLHS